MSIKQIKTNLLKDLNSTHDSVFDTILNIGKTPLVGCTDEQAAKIRLVAGMTTAISAILKEQVSIAEGI